MTKGISIVSTLVAVLVIAYFAFAGFSPLWNRSQKEEAPSSKAVAPMDTGTIFVGGQRYDVEIARTPEEQVQGLSGRPSLSKGTGMLFWFGTDGKYPFWMPDMRFSIDIVWIGSDWRVAHIEKDVSPESYPNSFSSPTPARYVLELEAGEADRIGLKEGLKIVFTRSQS